MKAKLVKYPFNEKKYRWDTYKAGREFQYFWDESLPKNFDTIEPYIEVKNFTYDENKKYAYIDLKNQEEIIDINTNAEFEGYNVEQGDIKLTPIDDNTNYRKRYRVARFI